MAHSKYRMISVVPGPMDYESNPEMYCNLAREDPMIERCLTCTENCKHAGKKTVFFKEEIKFGG